MYTVFHAHIPAYTHPSGRAVPATDVKVFGCILATLDAEARIIRDLTRDEARAALLAHWPALENVDGIEIKRSAYKADSSWQCDVVPHYAIPA